VCAVQLGGIAARGLARLTGKRGIDLRPVRAHRVGISRQIRAILRYQCVQECEQRGILRDEVRACIHGFVIEWMHFHRREVRLVRLRKEFAFVIGRVVIERAVSGHGVVIKLADAAGLGVGQHGAMKLMHIFMQQNHALLMRAALDVFDPG
jgi:hypothetical protein